MEKGILLKVASQAKQRYIIVIWSFWIVFLVEFLNRGQAVETLQWSLQHVAQFIINSIVVGCLLLLFISITGRARISFWVVSLLTLILSMISGIKLKILGVPLLPWDIALSGEGKDMAQYIKNIFTLKTSLGLLFFLIVSWGLLYLIPHFHKKSFWKERIVVAVLSVILIAVLYYDKPIPIKGWLQITSMPWNQGDNVRTNGFFLTMMMNVQEMYVGKPSDYNEDAITTFVKQRSESIATNEGINPNIIVILSEAFWDPSRIKDISFSRDPLPFFHSIQQKYSSGWMLSPQYGGGTANVEFEVLTGNSMRFLPQGSVAYNQYITHGIDSLASILARQGYTSTAINPFHNWFFNSRKVYEDFGFSKFISIEFFNPVYEGPYIADNEVVNNIFESTRRSSGPDFVFANTMENHFHFYPGKFKENTIDIKGVTGESQGMLETYAQGLVDADKMLQNLVEHYTEVDEPTIIVFFGDHLPYLGDDYEAYKDTKYISGENDPDFLNKMYRVPVVVWDNYLPLHKDTLDLSPSFLSPYILDLAKKRGTYYTDYLRDLSKRFPIIPPKNYYLDMNITENDLKQYETLQYDIIFGERHGYGDLKDKIINPQYMLGYEPIIIDQVVQEQAIASDNAPVTLIVSGKYFPPQSVVYINGKPLTTQREQEGKLSVKVSSEIMMTGTLAVQVKIIDIKDTTIANSNTVPFIAIKK